MTTQTEVSRPPDVVLDPKKLYTPRPGRVITWPRMGKPVRATAGDDFATYGDDPALWCQLPDGKWHDMTARVIEAPEGARPTPVEGHANQEFYRRRNYMRLPLVGHTDPPAEPAARKVGRSKRAEAKKAVTGDTSKHPGLAADDDKGQAEIPIPDSKREG